MSEKVNLVGFWNGSETDPKITFKADDTECNLIVKIELTTIPQNKELKNAINSTKRNIDKLSESVNRLLNFPKR